MNSFRSIDELIQALSREKTLLKEMFAKRKTLSFRLDLAETLVDYKMSRIQYLVDYGVIRDNGNFLELEDVYLKFFEEVLKVNEEINVESVKANIDHLNETIEYYLQETNESSKYNYLREVRRSLKNIALNTKRNVIDLKRNVDNTYKNEPNYKIKKSKLKHLDEKRDGIKLQIKEAERVLENQTAFFKVAMDADLQIVIDDLRYDLNESSHNLIEIEKQIIDYLNLIDYQSELLKKIRQVKYFRDQQVLETNTDVANMLANKNPVWMEPSTGYRIKVSLDWLRSTDGGLSVLREVQNRRKIQGKQRKQLADPLDQNEMAAQSIIIPMVDQTEMKNGFMAAGTDLFYFVMNYSYPYPIDLEGKLVLFCQLVSQFSDELEITDKYTVAEGFEYPLIYPR
ncbi:hypothetical protein [Hallerella succinigenes]|uniref:Uncharacterized protein n=1 Tax=Hallerella succinigenes TaxID=1896222 RepID=A0A2M9A505_9BACT|nr:hypothetical protein [Hallerella succinigenes]PJJ40805.1 hypothetical protein BGX16_0752 [Hallerella succinigenes]